MGCARQDCALDAKRALRPRRLHPRERQHCVEPGCQASLALLASIPAFSVAPLPHTCRHAPPFESPELHRSMADQRPALA